MAQSLIYLIDLVYNHDLHEANFGGSKDKSDSKRNSSQIFSEPKNKRTIKMVQIHKGHSMANKINKQSDRNFG